MPKKKLNKCILCAKCLIKEDCDFKGKDDPKERVVDSSGLYGITLVCPEELGGYPVLAELPPVQKKKTVKADKENADDFVMISGKVFSRIRRQLKDKKIVVEEKSASLNPDDVLDKAFSKEIKIEEE